ncbi:type ISP restriction/modification enzyme [Bernardetia sp.]|uniref:type ISP restriction/modification enzyme n=1 Tax=Bernardetia sp. TaxID=1937974 RepID=UPI0025BC18CA|nr:type ISP restriction/modification enzyme [Bernardetia sp.]
MQFENKNTALPKFFAIDNVVESLQEEFEKNNLRKTSEYRSLGAFASQFHSLPDDNLLKTAILSHQIVEPLLKLLSEENQYSFLQEDILFKKLEAFSSFFKNGFLEQWKKYSLSLEELISDFSKPKKEQLFVYWQNKFELGIAPLEFSSFIQQSIANIEAPSLYQSTFFQDIQPSIGHSYTSTLSIWSYYFWKIKDTTKPTFWANAAYFVDVPKQTLLFGSQESEAEEFYRSIDAKYHIIVGNSFKTSQPTQLVYSKENDKNENKTKDKNSEEADFSAIDNRVMAAYTPIYEKNNFSPVPLRFVRWATDRLTDKGVVAIWLPSIVLHAPTYEGFRKRVQSEFDSVYVMDLDYKNVDKENPTNIIEEKTELSKNEKDNKKSFSNKENESALLFLVRKNKQNYSNGFRLAHLRSQCPVYYWKPTKNFKSFKNFGEALARTQFQNLSFKKVSQAVNYWIALPEDDFLGFMPLTHKATQTAKFADEETALFKWASPALLTARDEWMYDFDKENLAKKANYFSDIYEQERKAWHSSEQKELLPNFLGIKSKEKESKIKWNAELMQHLKRDEATEYDSFKIREASYRPFVKQFVYVDEVITHRPYQQFRFFPLQKEQTPNPTICVTVHKQVPLVVHATNFIPDNGYGARATYTFAKYYFDEETDSFKENITDWALEQFRHHYSSKPVKFKAKNFKELKKNLQSMKDNQVEARTLTKDTIFAYIYAVLHSPDYRKKYKKILHTELPRIPMYEDFWKWATWGEKLLNLHLNYEDAIIYPLEREEKEDDDNEKNNKKAILKADRVRSLVWIDENTYLKNIPEEAWHYRLGVRSALEWVLEHHSERKLRDKTVKKAVEKGLFTTYSFENQKEHLIELLRKVCRVSVETVKVLREMEG